MQIKTLLSIGLLLFIQNQITAQPYQLTVKNGYGSGTYNAGDTVYIYAKELPNDSIVKSWISLDPVYFERKNEWVTRMVMPQKNTLVACQLEYGTPVNEKQIQIKIGGMKKNVWYAIPANPKGMVTLHHFTSGTGNLFWSRVEYRKLCHYLYAKGYALFSYNAYEVETMQGPGIKQWFVTPTDLNSNKDHQAARDLIDSLVSRNLILQNIPKFALGMSVGGSYTSSLALALQFNGWVNFCTKGNRQIYDSTNVDGFHIPSQHDFNDGTDSDESIAYSNFLLLKNRLPNSEFILHKRYPMHKERFKKVSAINATESVNLFNNLVSKNFLNAKFEPIIQADTLEYVAENFPNQLPAWSALGTDVRKECVYQYRSAFGDHELSMDYNYAIWQFFESHLVKSNAVKNASQQCVQIFPNPVEQKLQIKSAELITKIEIYNLQGQLVFSQNTEPKTLCNIDLSGLSKGIYLLRTNNTFIGKFVKL